MKLIAVGDIMPGGVLSITNTEYATKEVRDYLNGDLSYNEMVEKIKQESRRYAKRQLTWFRKNKETVWIDGLNDTNENINIILEAINIE